jgi:hypothetical protein
MAELDACDHGDVVELGPAAMVGGARSSPGPSVGARSACPGPKRRRVGGSDRRAQAAREGALEAADQR